MALVENNGPNYKLDRDKHAAPQIYQELRRRIIELELVPGTVLSRNDIAQQFGVSVTPVRDAIQKLAEEDLVEIFAQSTTRVTEIDLEHARQSHFLRVSVEMEAVLLLASGDYRMQLKEIRKQLKHQKEALQANAKDVPGLFDLSFHRQLCEVANVGKLWSLIRAHSGHLDRLRRLFHPEPKRGLSDHLAILTAIEAGDAVKAQMLLRQHHSRMMLSTDEIRSKNPGYLRG